tara:strand:- start:550 stop:711 length:162 start_codon:yes stop_codon:yes gene_type:complete
MNNFEYKDKIYVFVINYWNYLFTNTFLDISNIKLLREKEAEEETIDISDIEEE